MEAHPRRLKTVFRSDVRLVVPLFQRPYVWDEDGQWAPLWEDVITTFDRREEREEDEIAPHFLGAIVLEQKRGALGSLEVREVIDGQQRLTTLQILIAALRDAYRALGVKTRLLSRLTKTLVNDADYVDSPDEEFKLWPTNRDRSAYTAVMRGDYRDSTQDPALPRIAAAYVFFREQIDAFLVRSDEEESETILDGLAEVLLEHLEVVVIDLGVDDNAQVIFETLNARGTALRASDLIKNALFRTLQDSGRPVDMLYEKYWEPLELPQWQTEVRLGRLRRPRLDIYVGFFLTVLLHREVQSHQLFTAARAYFGSDADRAEDFLTELARYARIHDQLDTGHIGTDAEQGCLTRLEIADTQTITPVLLWLFAHTDGADRQRALTLLEAYVVRRAICRLTSKNYNRLFLELLRRLSASEGPASGVIEQFLTSQDSESGLWPSDSDLRDALRSLPLYRLFKRDRLQRLLLAFEQHLTTDRTEPIPPQLETVGRAPDAPQLARALGAARGSGGSRGRGRAPQHPARHDRQPHADHRETQLQPVERSMEQKTRASARTLGPDPQQITADRLDHHLDRTPLRDAGARSDLDLAPARRAWRLTSARHRGRARPHAGSRPGP